MGIGQDVFNLAKQKGKTVVNKYTKKIVGMILKSPVFWLVLAIILFISILFIIIIGNASSDNHNTENTNTEGYTNVGESNFSGQELVNIAQKLHDYIRINQYAYSCKENVDGGYVNTCECNKSSHFGKSNFEEYDDIKCIDCSAYVSWVLNQYLGDSFNTRRTSHWFNNSNNWPAGWKKIDMEDIQAGDILVKFNESTNTGHVGIYIGNGKTVEAGSTRAIRAEYSYGSPQAVINSYEFAIRIS